MIKKSLVLFLICFTLLFGHTTKSWADINEFPSALGFFSGTVYAENLFGGLQYQHWFSTNGFQVEGGVIFSPSDNVLDYSIIGDYLYPVYGNEYSDKMAGRLYLFGTLGHIGKIITEYNYENYITENHLRFSIMLGFGIGIEVIAYKHFSFPIHFGYAADWPINLSSVNQPFIGLMIASGLRYRF